jgi:hypothetical protein
MMAISASQHSPKSRRLARARKAAIQGAHHAEQQDQERQNARQRRNALGDGIGIPAQDRMFDAGAEGIAIFLAKAHHGIDREHPAQQHAGTEAGEKQAPERLFRRDGIEDHGDRRRQQDAQRTSGRDDAGGQPRRIATPSHFRNASAADRGASGRARSRHRREQRAGHHIGDAETAGHAIEPHVQRIIEIGAGARSCSALADERLAVDASRGTPDSAMAGRLMTALMPRITTSLHDLAGVTAVVDTSAFCRWCRVLSCSHSVSRPGC